MTDASEQCHDGATGTSANELVRARQQLVAPRSNSKSLAKALGCPAYFVGQWMQRYVFADNPHYLAKTGTEFHLYRQRYVQHLVETGKSSDRAWRVAYLENEHLSEDVRQLILDDTFSVDPGTVVGCEVFLSIDRDFQPIVEPEVDRKPGVLSTHPDALCSGTIDLILMLDGGRRVVIRDPKSGFSTVGVTDEEPPIYAALIMAHWPRVEVVEFVWDFVRKDAIKRSRYERNDLPWIHQLIVEIDTRKYDYVERYNSGEPLPANPLSGLCPYCQVTCPMRPRYDAGELALGPCQTEEDFRRVMLLKKVCDDVSKRAAKIGLSYLDAHGGKKELGSDWEAEACVTQTLQYPLLEALDLLGLQLVTKEGGSLPSNTPAYDVPLASLKVSGLSESAKRRRSKRGVSRIGMKDQLRAIAKESSYTKLVIRKRPQQVPELAELLAASLELVGDESG